MISSKVKLLDVGSCYNPFSAFDKLDVLAIDLCPARDSVYQCDFLNVLIADLGSHQIEMNNVISLQPLSFNCVVFSFLLEYFPSPLQRWNCCLKAQQLLCDEGLLIIITPDSKACHSNSKMMKSWREALSTIGLKRIRYQKLLHAHCMAFRKTCSNIVDNQDTAKKMYIVQDFNNQGNNSDGKDRCIITPCFNAEELVEGFSLLPHYDDDD